MVRISCVEADLANPKTNKKTAGFTKEERDGFTELLNNGFIDTFRYLHPDTKNAYTFWTYMMNARAKNVGWQVFCNLRFFCFVQVFIKHLFYFIGAWTTLSYLNALHQNFVKALLEAIFLEVITAPLHFS